MAQIHNSSHRDIELQLSLLSEKIENMLLIGNYMILLNIILKIGEDFLY